jgi:hypothetical protein
MGYADRERAPDRHLFGNIAPRFCFVSPGRGSLAVLWHNKGFCKRGALPIAMLENDRDDTGGPSI